MTDSIKSAERRVDDSLGKFETAMNQLALKVEGTTETIQHVVHVAALPKQKMNELVDFVDPYLQGAKVTAREFAERVRKNPEPYVIGLVALIGGYLVTRWLSRRADASARIHSY